MSMHKKFWSKVNKNGPIIRPELGPCWMWLGPRMKRKGAEYGLVKADYDPTYRQGRKSRRKKLRTHRVAWELKHGPIPPGKWVLHRCDNPPCVRDDHLFLGDAQANIDDMVDKGRLVVLYGAENPNFGVINGENNPSAKLTWDAVELMRALAKSGSQPAELSEMFGVKRSTCSRIIHGRAWIRNDTWISKAQPAKLTWEGVILLRALAKSGSTLNELSKMFGICTLHTRNIIKNRHWRAAPE